MIDHKKLRSLLSTTILSGRTISSVKLPFSPEPVLMIECSSHERLSGWKVLRELLPATGRWPIFTCGWIDDIPTELAIPSAALEPGPAELVRRSLVTSVPEALERLPYARTAFDVWDYWVEDRLGELSSHFGSSPSMTDARAALPSTATELDVERWLFEWERTNFPDWCGSLDKEFDDSYAPEGQLTALLLLPTQHSWHALAYLDFYGSEKPGEPELAMTLLRTWENQFDAELWAFYGTMLEFVVNRPPQSIDETWSVATQHHTLAPCTNQLPGVNVREYAHWLTGRKTWHLHERP